MACFINYCQIAGFVLINKTHSGFLSFIVCIMYEKITKTSVLKVYNVLSLQQNKTSLPYTQI